MQIENFLRHRRDILRATPPLQRGLIFCQINTVVVASQSFGRLLSQAKLWLWLGLVCNWRGETSLLHQQQKAVAHDVHFN